MRDDPFQGSAHRGKRIKVLYHPPFGSFFVVFFLCYLYIIIVIQFNTVYYLEKVMQNSPLRVIDSNTKTKQKDGIIHYYICTRGLYNIDNIK